MLIIKLRRLESDFSSSFLFAPSCVISFFKGFFLSSVSAGTFKARFKISMSKLRTSDKLYKHYVYLPLFLVLSLSLSLSFSFCSSLFIFTGLSFAISNVMCKVGLNWDFQIVDLWFKWMEQKKSSFRAVFTEYRILSWQVAFSAFTYAFLLSSGFQCFWLDVSHFSYCSLVCYVFFLCLFLRFSLYLWFLAAWLWFA